MERIKPSDLTNASLTRAANGYDIDEVDGLLRRAASEFTELTNEIQQLKSEIANLKPIQRQMSALADVIVAAQKSADEQIAAASRIADEIIAEGRRRSDDFFVASQERALEFESEQIQRLNEIQRQTDQVGDQKDQLVESYRRFLAKQLDSLNKFSAQSTALAVVQAHPDRDAAAVSA